MREKCECRWSRDAKDLIDIEANRAIAVAGKSADIEQKKADAQQTFELARKEKGKKRGQVFFLRVFEAVGFRDAQNPPRLPCE